MYNKKLLLKFHRKEFSFINDIEQYLEGDTVMGIPIFFIHQGNPGYLKLALNQVRLYNPTSEIYLIGDEKNNVYDFVNHININRFTKSSGKFENVYKHMSSNSYDYELFCFKRWFILKDFLEFENIREDFIYLDSDVLLYCNLNEKKKLFKNYDLTVSNVHGPQYTYMKNLSVLKKFCDFTLEMYTDSNRIKYLSNRYENFIKNNQPGGNCDMTVLGLFNKEEKAKVLDLYKIINNEIFIHNFNKEPDFITKKGILQINWIQNKPYVQLKDSNKEYIKVNAIHFQGSSKVFMFKLYSGNLNFIEKKVILIIGILKYNLKKAIKRFISK